MIPDSLWQVVAQSGFNAVLVLILLYFGRMELIEIRKTHEKNLADMRKSQDEMRKAHDRNTKMVTIALLSIASLVPGSKSQLQSLKDDLDQTERDDATKREES